MRYLLFPAVYHQQACPSGVTWCWTVPPNSILSAHFVRLSPSSCQLLKKSGSKQQSWLIRTELSKSAQLVLHAHLRKTSAEDYQHYLPQPMMQEPRRMPVAFKSPVSWTTWALLGLFYVWETISALKTFLTDQTLKSTAAWLNVYGTLDKLKLTSCRPRFPLTWPLLLNIAFIRFLSFPLSRQSREEDWEVTAEFTKEPCRWRSDVFKGTTLISRVNISVTIRH